jgi:hypothetical protein
MSHVLSQSSRIISTSVECTFADDGGGDCGGGQQSLLTVRRRRRRYIAKGVDGLLKDATRPSRVKPLSPEKVKQVVQ